MAKTDWFYLVSDDRVNFLQARFHY